METAQQTSTTAKPMKRVITAVYSGLTGTWYHVGVDGVDSIVQEQVNGEMARVPWIFIEFDDGRQVNLAARHCEIHRSLVEMDEEPGLPF